MYVHLMAYTRVCKGHSQIHRIWLSGCTDSVNLKVQRVHAILLCILALRHLVAESTAHGCSAPTYYVMLYYTYYYTCPEGSVSRHNTVYTGACVYTRSIRYASVYTLSVVDGLRRGWISASAQAHAHGMRRQHTHSIRYAIQGVSPGDP